MPRPRYPWSPSTLVGGLCLVLGSAPASAQRSLAPLAPSGQSVTPVFEGWYRNADGTYSLSFGYFNRNDKERVEIAVGDSNFVSPGEPNQGQPTHFAPRRNWGVFTVVVPANFDPKAKVTWTLISRGQKTAIPGSLNPDWQIDAIEGEASANNTPPALRWSASTPEGRGPGGVKGGPVDAKVGVPTALTILATDDGATKTPVDLSWYKHQGPGTVTFSTPTSRLTPTGGTGTTTATFSAPGTYLVRVRAGDAAASTAGHSQCCWTNAFVTVRVTP
ncbi:MAG: hypothetical protein K2R93_21660 [Gemmatimonadaceae bacterium]|nr:hypothetical protein [Gemmatimonadaceae bacterium]